MNLFTVLREHAATRSEMIASRSSRRLVTYRKLWSRIERATARMKSEWQVRPGDTVVYWGHGHQDALMFYLAAARCGARLLPLEHRYLQQRAGDILHGVPVVLLLHDDEIVLETPLAIPHVANLSTLIATRCHHQPEVEEDDRQTSLLSTTLAPDGAIAYEAHSLQQLFSAAQQFTDVDETRPFLPGDALFDADMFVPRVLPRLIAGGTLQFR